MDVGAHWVGRTQHRVMELARQFGLGLRSQYLKGTKVMQVRAHSTDTLLQDYDVEFRWVMRPSEHMTQSYPTLDHGLPS